MNEEILKLPASKKAYEIDRDRLNEGFLSDEIVCHADTRGKAKRLLLDEICYDGWKLKWGEEVNYLNIPIRRKKEADKVLFEGEEISRRRVAYLLAERDRQRTLDTFEQSDNEYFYILKGGVYYAPHSCGYTQFQTQAGVYTKEEALKSARFCSELKLKPVDIKSHNKKILDRIADLESRILK